MPRTPDSEKSANPLSGERSRIACGATIWPWAGLCAGAAVGAGDTLWAVGRGIGGLGALKALKLVLLGSSWLALAGVVAGALVALGGAVVRRAARSKQGVLAAAFAALIAAPFLTYDAFAAFAGRRAAEIPRASDPLRCFGVARCRYRVRCGSPVSRGRGALACGNAFRSKARSDRGGGTCGLRHRLRACQSVRLGAPVSLVSRVVGGSDRRVRAAHGPVGADVVVVPQDRIVAGAVEASTPRDRDRRFDCDSGADRGSRRGGVKPSDSPRWNGHPRRLSCCGCHPCRFVLRPTSPLNAWKPRASCRPCPRDRGAQRPTCS